MNKTDKLNELDGILFSADVLLQKGFYEKAYYEYEKALMFNQQSKEAKEGLAGISFIQGQFFIAQSKTKEALWWIEKAVLFSEADYNRVLSFGYALLLAGQLKEGFSFLEKRKEGIATQKYCKHLNMIKEWQGENLTNKKILIQHEHGFGDSLFFISFLSSFREMLKEKGYKNYQIIVSVPQELKRLFEKIEGIDEVVLWDEKKNILSEKVDYFLLVMSLPACIIKFATKLYFNRGVIGKNFKQTRDYQLFQIDKSEKNEYNLSKKTFKIGFCLACDKKRDYGRSVSLFDFSVLFQNEKLSFYSLQIDQDKELATFLIGNSQIFSNVFDFSEKFKDFYDTALFMLNMDLVITVDTAVAHLAGMLGLKTFLLLPLPDLRLWRWGISQKECLWYKNITIFRQKEKGNWREVLLRVNEQLETEIKIK